MLAARLAHAPDEARRQPRARRLLGPQEPAAALGDHHRLGGELRQRLLQGQPQPALQHVRLRGARAAQGAHARARVRLARRRVEPAERDDQGTNSTGLSARRQQVVTRL